MPCLPSTIAGLRLRNGELELRVNNDEFSTAAPGAIVHGGFSNDLVIGQSFQGYMGDLKIGAERSAATLISLGNDTTEQTLPIGRDGKAVFTVKNLVMITRAYLYLQIYFLIGLLCLLSNINQTRRDNKSTA
jgi:hypothetical protein